MKKQDLIVIAILFGLMLAWPMVYTRFLAPPRPAAPAPAAAPDPAGAPGAAEASAPPQAPELAVAPPPAAPAAEPPTAVRAPRQPETLVALTNAHAALVFSTRGGGLVAAQLNGYRRTVDPDSGPMRLEFSNSPALVFHGLPGLSADDDAAVRAEPGGEALHIEARRPDGLCLNRTVVFLSDYQVRIETVLRNEGPLPVAVPEHGVQLGPMRADPASVSGGAEALGADLLMAAGGEGVQHRAKDLLALFKQAAAPGGGLPRTVQSPRSAAADWVAVKNKFFVQILAPEGGAPGVILSAERALAPGEADDPARAPRRPALHEVAAQVRLPARTLAPGEQAVDTLRYYVGPKKYSILRRLGLHQEEVMEFGFWNPVCKFLLFVLNQVYEVVPNYGVAIIVLTILIRILFWPLTHKSTESMKRMQELQPRIAELRQACKDNPRKLQAETMALYRAHKVNPVSGCLPMLIQIPVFIALFVVLRSAIELRFAPFLWVRDLSEPERLLAGLLPIPLNILPIFMAATQVLQQALTPSADASQQRMMMFLMPGMMLVMFYMMPAALVLYWSANQVLMIVQQLLQKQRSVWQRRRATA